MDADVVWSTKGGSIHTVAVVIVVMGRFYVGIRRKTSDTVALIKNALRNKLQ